MKREILLQITYSSVYLFIYLFCGTYESDGRDRQRQCSNYIRTIMFDLNILWLKFEFRPKT